MCHRRRIAGQAGRENPVQEARGAEPGFIETNYVVDFTDGQTYFNSINTLRESLSDPIGQTSMFRARNTGDQIAVSMCKDGAIKAQIIMDPQDFYVFGYLNLDDKTQIMSAIDKFQNPLVKFTARGKSVVPTGKQVTYGVDHLKRIFDVNYFKTSIENIDFLDYATIVSEAIRFKIVQHFIASLLKRSGKSHKNFNKLSEYVISDSESMNYCGVTHLKRINTKEELIEIMKGMINGWANLTGSYDQPFFNDLTVEKVNFNRDAFSVVYPNSVLENFYIRLTERYFVRFRDAGNFVGVLSVSDKDKGLVLKETSWNRE